MSLFDAIFGKRQERVQAETFFKTFSAYSPVFTSWNGMLYESELVRYAVDARARHISKLKVDFMGAAKPKLRAVMKHRPNDFQTWSQFMYRLSTILDMQNTAFIVPVLDKYAELKGYYCVLPSRCAIVEANGKQYLRYQFSTGQTAAVEFARCGIVTKFQYKDDFFGETNRALTPTMDLITMQNQGIREGIKSSASFRFMAELTNFKSPKDLVEEQKNFTSTNFKADAGGLLLFPNTYRNVQQIKSTPFTVDAEQMKLIQTNVFNYFAVNEKIVQNTAIGDELDAFYEGAIEPFAIQLSEVMSKMTYTDIERSYGSFVFVSANRLQYMKTSDKINFIEKMTDRGLMTVNEARELLNYSPLTEGGDRLPVRGEYWLINSDGSAATKAGAEAEDVKDTEGDDE